MADIQEAIVVSGIHTNIIDPVDGKSKNYKEVTTWWDGTPMDNSKVDGTWFRRKGTTYLRQVIDKEGELFLEKDTVSQLRALSPLEILFLRGGVYKGVKLNGYYEKGDTPAPIEYYLSDTTESDDGGSVFEVGDIKLEHKFNNYVNVLNYGILSGQLDEGKIQSIIDKYSSENKLFTIKFNEGVYEINSPIILRSGIGIEGVGKLKTMFYREGGMSVIRSEEPTMVSLNLSEGVEAESTILRLQDTSSVGVGDFILIESKISMRYFWQDLKYGDSKKFNQGELLKVKEVNHNSNEVILDSRTTFKYNLEDIDNVRSFTPNRNSSIDNIGVYTDIVEVETGIGIDVSYFEDFNIGDIYSKGFNIAGARISSSIGTYLKSLFAEGGDDVAGQNYGLLVYNGSKFSTIGTVEGRGCRHTFAGGSDGRGIPMFNTIKEVRHYKSKETNLHGVDCHISTAYFTFGHLYSENGISIDGLGHSVNTSFNKGGSLYIQYSGGRDLYINEYTHINPEYESHAPGTVSKNVKINNLRILSNGNSFSGQQDLRLFRHGEGVYINNLELNNLDSDIYQSNQEATEKSFRHFMINKPIRIGKLKIKGYVSVRIAHSDVHINDLELEDCNWEGSQSVSAVGTVTIGSTSEVVRNLTINKITAHNVNANLTFNGTYIRILDTQSPIGNVILRNISYKEEEQLYPNAFRNSSQNDIDNLVLENMNVEGSYFTNFDYLNKNIFVLNCNYINEYKLPVTAGSEGQVLMKSTGNTLVWTDLKQTAAAQSNSTATDVEGLVSDFNSLLSKMRTAGLLAN